MTESSSSLFAPDPARDPRFVVKERWAECANFRPEHPLRQIEFLHRQMNEEVDSLESSAQTLADFPETDWELRMLLARQCWDEARHAAMFRRLFERRGGVVGQYPVLNFQYRIICRAETLMGRLAIQNRSFEAGGLDAVEVGIDEARSRSDTELAELFEAQLADEIVHVRFANEWIHKVAKRDPRTLLKVGAALTRAARAFEVVMGKEGVKGTDYPASMARREAGFSADEISVARDLAAGRGDALR